MEISDTGQVVKGAIDSVYNSESSQNQIQLHQQQQHLQHQQTQHLMQQQLLDQPFLPNQHAQLQNHLTQQQLQHNEIQLTNQMEHQHQLLQSQLQTQLQQCSNSVQPEILTTPQTQPQRYEQQPIQTNVQGSMWRVAFIVVILCGTAIAIQPDGLSCAVRCMIEMCLPLEGKCDGEIRQNATECGCCPNCIKYLDKGRACNVQGLQFPEVATTMCRPPFECIDGHCDDPPFMRRGMRPAIPWMDDHSNLL